MDKNDVEDNEKSVEEKRYSNYKFSSVEDIFAEHYTPEERKRWTEIIVSDSNDLPQNTDMTSKSKNEKNTSVNSHNKSKNDSNDTITEHLEEISETLKKSQIVLRKPMTKSTFGHIFYAKHRQNPRIALKVIDLLISDNRGFVGNSFAKNQLKHKNIIEVFEVIKDKNLILVVMPLGLIDVFEYLYKKGSPKERDAKRVIQQILRGIQYIHNKGWAHRDIKLENCLIFSDSVKICDFDLMTSAVDNNGNPLHNNEIVGTLAYMPPELFNGKGSPDLRMSDLWSCGVLSFALITFGYPFGPIEDLKNVEKVLEELWKMKFKLYSYPKQCSLSIQCKSFIAKLLEFDPYSRQTIDLLLSDQWFSKDFLNI